MEFGLWPCCLLGWSSITSNKWTRCSEK